MAIRQKPRREHALDSALASQGGLRSVVFSALERGERVPDIAEHISQNASVTISASRLYEWIRRWNEEKNDVAGQDAREKTGVGAP